MISQALLDAATEFNSKRTQIVRPQGRAEGPELARRVSCALDKLAAKHGLSPHERQDILSAAAGLQAGVEGEQAVVEGRRIRAYMRDKFDPSWRQQKLGLNDVEDTSNER